MKNDKKKKMSKPNSCEAAQIFAQLSAEQQEAILKLMREIVKQPR